eukprot:COSAG01_NODE_3478_length_6026_cov_3.252067_2_plen_72_part_00
MKSIGLGDKVDTVEAYLSGAETVADAGFVEFLEASDDYVDEMVDEEELDMYVSSRLQVQNSIVLYRPKAGL